MIEPTLRKMVEAFNKHDVKAVADFYAADVLIQDPQYPEPLQGKEAVLRDIEMFLNAFPDMTASIVSTVENGSEIAMEAHFGGTHKGTLPGPEGHEIPPTNKRVDMIGGFFMTVDSEGLITSERRYMNMAEMMMQLGLLP